MAHVSDHSNHHQVNTDFTFTGKCSYIELPSQYLSDNTRLQKNFLLFLALQSLVARESLPQLPYVFSVLRLTHPFPYTCKSLLMLGCLRCFHLVSGFIMQPRQCVQTSRVESHESCRVKSLDAAYSTFVSQTLVIGRDGCCLEEEMDVEKLILLVKDHEAIHDVSRCEHRNRVLH